MHTEENTDELDISLHGMGYLHANWSTS